MIVTPHTITQSTCGGQRDEAPHADSPTSGKQLLNGLHISATDSWLVESATSRVDKACALDNACNASEGLTQLIGIAAVGNAQLDSGRKWSYGAVYDDHSALW